MAFSIERRLPGGLGRAGLLRTPHGDIETPAFVAVGTKATVKALTPDQLEALSAQVVLGNTYHLYLQPGEDIVEKAGGLGSFMNWSGPTMTDSGGFQVFSLGAAWGKRVSKVAEAAPVEEGLAVYDEDIASQHGRLAIIDEEGVTFTSHLDGSLHRFTPERSVEIQHKLGADVIFAFDECTSPSEPYAYQREALDRTHRWAARSLEAHRRNLDARKRQALFGIVQGGRHEDLRRESARSLAQMDFDGFGIGGSFTKKDMDTAVGWVSSELPEEKPRHLLGIGEPLDLFGGVENGADLFDCVAPTRLGRTGVLYTSAGKLNLLGAAYTEDFGKPDPQCACYTCSRFTRAYLAHLFRAKEMLGATLLSLHNLHFIVELVSGIRRSILEGNFDSYRQAFEASYRA